MRRTRRLSHLALELPSSQPSAQLYRDLYRDLYHNIHAHTGGLDLAGLQQSTGIAAPRLQTLLTSLVCIKASPPPLHLAPAPRDRHDSLA